MPGKCVSWHSPPHVETCVLLEQLRKSDAHVKVSVDMDELNMVKENS